MRYCRVENVEVGVAKFTSAWPTVRRGRGRDCPTRDWLLGILGASVAVPYHSGRLWRTLRLIEGAPGGSLRRDESSEQEREALSCTQPGAHLQVAGGRPTRTNQARPPAPPTIGQLKPSFRVSMPSNAPKRTAWGLEPSHFPPFQKPIRSSAEPKALILLGSLQIQPSLA